MICTIDIKDEVWCIIKGLSKFHNDALQDMFSPYVEGYRHMPLFKLGRWNGKVSFYEKSGKTYVRLLTRIVPSIENWGYEIELIDNRKYIEPPALITSKCFRNTEIELRPYQVQAVNACINAGSGIVIAGTGAGKTLITAALSNAYSLAGYNTITMVPSSDLVTQTADFYQSVGLDTGIYSGDAKDPHHLNVVATWQSIQNIPRLLKDFDCILWDELHGAKAQVAQKLLNEDAAHMIAKFGVTGTFPKPLADQLSIHGAIGDILIEITAKWLIDNGYLAEVEIHQICLKQPNKEQFPDYASEKAYLVKNSDRMDVIADLIIARCEEYGNTLVLVSSVPFGEKLASLINGAVFLSGASKKADRKIQYDTFAEGEDVITIATEGIAKQGISIDRVKNFMFIDIGKSFITTIQGVGRGTRLAHDKRKVFVADVYADLKWAKKHAKERKRWYAEAQYPVTQDITIKI